MGRMVGQSWYINYDYLVYICTNTFAAIISAQSGIPRILVGLLGCTGAGKSSLISAFVEEKSIVPSCSFRATTAVAVEVAWNPSNDPESAYRAEVEFISSQEWLDEVNFLLREIKARPDGEELKVGSTSDAGIAYSKVAAIYPDVSSLPLKKITASRLNKTRDLSIVLGSTIHIQGSSAKRLSELIKKYIVSDNQGSQDGVNYWPLVRVVRIFTKADDLKTGLVLVDLPGLGDSNAARANVCQKYLQNLNHLWIVADIARAVDSKIAKDLMGQKFQRQLCLDGRYDDNFITFIMTHMDILPTQSVIEDLQLEGQVLKSEFQEEARLKDIKKRVEEKLQSMKQIRKRKRDEGENKHLSNGKELKRELKEVTKALTKLNNVIKARCIKERNAWVQDHIQMDFQNGLNELRQDMEDENNTTPLSLNSQGILI
jgi:GTPase SAR1 family protein